MVNYDAIRLFAVVAIVVLHTAANGVNRLPFASADWWLANLLDSAARAGVPLFLMLTGALFLPRRGESARQFLQRRWQRLALPLLCWSLFYLAWSALKAQVKHQPYQFADAVNALLSGTPYFHLWFIFMLPGVYLVLPAIRHYWQQLTESQQLQLTFGALILQQSLHLAAVLTGVWPDVPWPLWFIAYLPYLLLGAMLANQPAPDCSNTVANQQHTDSYLSARPAMTGKLAAFVALTLCTAGLHYLQYVPDLPTILAQNTGGVVLATMTDLLRDAPTGYAYHRLSLPVLLLAVVLWFLLGQSRLLGRAAASSSGQLLLRHSLTIYCLHPVFLDISTMTLQRLPVAGLPYVWLLAGQISLILAGCVVSCLSWDRFVQWQHKPTAPVN